MHLENVWLGGEIVLKMAKGDAKKVKIPRLIDKAGIAELQDMLPPVHFRQIRRMLAEFDSASDSGDFRGFQDRLADDALSYADVARHVRQEIFQAVRSAQRGSKGMRADSRYMDLLKDRFDDSSRLGNVSGFPLKGRRRSESDLDTDGVERVAADLGEMPAPEVSIPDLIREQEDEAPEFVAGEVRESDRMVQNVVEGPTLSLSADGPPSDDLVDSVRIDGGDLLQDQVGIAVDGVPDLSDQFEDVEAVSEMVAPVEAKPKNKKKKARSKQADGVDKSAYYDARSKRIGDYISEDQKRGSINIVEDAGSLAGEDDDDGF